MVTAAHGVRMQYDFTHDTAGRIQATAAWLRLDRAGSSVTAAESADGTSWHTIGSATLPGLPATVQVGLFATSPQYNEAVSGLLANGIAGGASRATGIFDHLSPAGGQWTGEAIGGPGNVAAEDKGGYRATGDGYAVTGSGDIAPSVSGAAGIGTTITQTLVGTFVGLIAVVVVAALFITVEYRRGLIRTTLAAGPRRGRMLAAKAVVVAGAVYPLGLAGAALVVEFGQRVLRGNGVYVHPASGLTELRLIAGTAALLSICAVLALAIGALVRRSAAAVATVIVVIVLPYLLSISVLPIGAADWLLRVTPAAAFAIQQSEPVYPQVDNVYGPNEGFFPLAPWAGFGVLCLWALAALALAAVRLRRSDA
jgi:hypothetical protein